MQLNMASHPVYNSSLVSQAISAYPIEEGNTFDQKARLNVQKSLHSFYLKQLGGPKEFFNTPEESSFDALIGIRLAENIWNAYEERRIRDIPLPVTSSDFESWYQEWRMRHREATAPLFSYLTKDASLTDMAIFFVMEERVDSRFDDLMALSQLGTSGAIKMTIARNYWDEMGDGDPDIVHTKMFDDSVRYMKQHLESVGVDLHDIESVPAIANASVLLMYGLRRRFNPRLIGALGILESTAAERFQAMVDGCKRLGVPQHVIKYQWMHVGIDDNHGQEWFTGVLMPLVKESPELMREIALGVVIRFNVATEYYASVYDHILQHKCGAKGRAHVQRKLS